jgi:hypothetical protein
MQIHLRLKYNTAHSLNVFLKRLPTICKKVFDIQLLLLPLLYEV